MLFSILREIIESGETTMSFLISMGMEAETCCGSGNIGLVESARRVPSLLFVNSFGKYLYTESFSRISIVDQDITANRKK